LKLSLDDIQIKHGEYRRRGIIVKSRYETIPVEILRPSLEAEMFRLGDVPNVNETKDESLPKHTGRTSKTRCS